MLLAFDVGNTNIVMGVFDGNKLVENFRMKTDKDKSADEYGMLIDQLFIHNGLSIGDVSDVIISTVVPSHQSHRCRSGNKDRNDYQIR